MKKVIIANTCHWCGWYALTDQLNADGNYRLNHWCKLKGLPISEETMKKNQRKSCDAFNDGGMKSK